MSTTTPKFTADVRIISEGTDHPFCIACRQQIWIGTYTHVEWVDSWGDLNGLDLCSTHDGLAHLYVTR